MSKKKHPFLGQDFIRALNNLLSTAQIHQANNRLLIDCVDSFLRTSGELLKNEDEITLLVSVGGFYLQQEKLIVQRNTAGLVRKLQAYFKQRQIDGLRLHQNISYASAEDIVAFAVTLNTCVRQEDPVHWLAEQMDADRFPWVEIIDPTQTESLEALFAEGTARSTTAPMGVPPSGASAPSRAKAGRTHRTGNSNKRPRETGATGTTPKPSGSADGNRERLRTRKALRTYSYAMSSLQTLSRRLSAHSGTGIGKTVLMIQNMVDLIMEDDNTLISLSTIRDYDDYTFTHSVNVAILAVCLGNRIGLSRIMLSRLGLAGLFHDLGKVDVPLHILNKPGRLDEQEYREIQKHSLNSVRRIIKLRASYDKKSSIILPPFEHHLKYDLSGYPRTPRKKPVSLLGRIITIADVYDAITSRRIYRTRHLSPDQALGLMFRESGASFDPILLKVFINMLGIYPVGTILKFHDDSMGIVCRPPEEASQEGSLWIMELIQQPGGGFSSGRRLAIGVWDPENGSYERPIKESCHPSELGIQPVEFLLEGF